MSSQFGYLGSKELDGGILSRRLIAWLYRRARGLQRGKFGAQLGDFFSQLRQLPSDVGVHLLSCNSGSHHAGQKHQECNTSAHR